MPENIYSSQNIYRHIFAGDAGVVFARFFVFTMALERQR